MSPTDATPRDGVNLYSVDPARASRKLAHPLADEVRIVQALLHTPGMCRRQIREALIRAGQAQSLADIQKILDSLLERGIITFQGPAEAPTSANPKPAADHFIVWSDPNSNSNAKRSPRVLHTSRASAEAEAQRLAKSQGHEFYVMQAVSVARPVVSATLHALD